MNLPRINVSIPPPAVCPPKPSIDWVRAAAEEILPRRDLGCSDIMTIIAKHAPKPPPPAPPPNVLYRGGNPRPLIPPDPGKTTGEYAPTWFSLLIGFSFGVMAGILFVLAGMVT